MLHHLRHVARWWSFVAHGVRLDRREFLPGEDAFRVGHAGAFLGEGPDFHRTTPGEGRAALPDLDRLIQAGGEDDRVAADRFLRFRIGTVGDGAATGAGDDPAFGRKGLAALEDAL